MKAIQMGNAICKLIIALYKRSSKQLATITFLPLRDRRFVIHIWVIIELLLIIVNINMQQPLQYKYEQYAEDFEPEDRNDKNKAESPLQVDFQAQTTPPESKLKTEE